MSTSTFRSPDRSPQSGTHIWDGSTTEAVVPRPRSDAAHIEDDLTKAMKLAPICDIVFLMDHPYNRDDAGILGNIIRVRSWDEINQKMRALL